MVTNGHVPFEIRFYNFPHLPKIGNIFEDNVVLFFCPRLNSDTWGLKDPWRLVLYYRGKYYRRKFEVELLQFLVKVSTISYMPEVFAMHPHICKHSVREIKERSEMKFITGNCMGQCTIARICNVARIKVRKIKFLKGQADEILWTNLVYLERTSPTWNIHSALHL